MGFLDAFDQLNGAGLKEQATELLYYWIIHREQDLYAELRARPVLKFWSRHPGNPDFDSTNPDEVAYESKQNWAFLLTSRTDVQMALDELSMRPYEGWRRENGVVFEVPWVLSMDNAPEHSAVLTAMRASMSDLDIVGKMDRAVRLHWADAKANLNHIDVRQYFRRVALSFTGEYFGIPASFIFAQAPGIPYEKFPSLSGIENLEQWSSEGYENFIWKIHSRHFVQEPNLGVNHPYLTKIYLVVQAISKMPIPDTVIARLKLSGTSSRLDPHRNIVGMIQGLVDNVMTNACIALNQFIAHGLVEVAANMNVAELIAEFRRLQAAHEAPSPFLPRFGRVHSSRTQSSLLSKYPDLRDAQIACAIGAAMTDPSGSDPSVIRLGYGMHECIGRELGDELTARALQPLLRLKSLDVVKPLLKKWGWIPQQFVVAADHPQRRNQVLIDQIANTAPSRPNPYSQWSSRYQGVENYSSWPSLIDRGWFSRHLAPAGDTYKQYLYSKVSTAVVSKLFQRKSVMKSGRSSLLFAFFAQWLTDSFLRTHPIDRRKTTSNHQLDLCQIYGLDDRTTRILRSGVDGMMKMESASDGKAYPPRLFDARGQVKIEFHGLPYVVNGQLAAMIRDIAVTPDNLRYLCASGLERGNSTVGYTALNTLFLREHNRICLLLKQNEGMRWDDERLFQTARMIMIVIEIKIIVEEYINHINTVDITKRPYRIDLEYLFAERRRWYRANWISVEFDLLYRWHSLVPDQMSFGGVSYDSKNMRGDNQPLFNLGLGAILRDASSQPAGRVQLLNSPDFLLPAEQAAVAMARDAELQPFNEYRKRFGIPPMTRFDQFNDAVAAAELQRIYGDIDKVEFLPGIVAEQPNDNQTSLFGLTMMTMVGYDAFTHALTNPLLSENVLTEEHLTTTGFKVIRETSNLNDLLGRNGETGVATFDYLVP